MPDSGVRLEAALAGFSRFLDVGDLALPRLSIPFRHSAPEFWPSVPRRYVPGSVPRIGANAPARPNIAGIGQRALEIRETHHIGGGATAVYRRSAAFGADLVCSTDQRTPSLGAFRRTEARSAKGQNGPALLNLQQAPEPYDVVGIARIDPVAERAAGVALVAAPRAATQHTKSAASCALGVLRRAILVVPCIIPVRAPLADVAEHIIESPRVWLLFPDGVSLLARVVPVPRVVPELRHVVPEAVLRIMVPKNWTVV